ncbi:MAG: hypothetical protein ACQGVC_18205 [Myxococcota bacterium]
MGTPKRPTQREIAAHLFLSVTKVKDYIGQGVIPKGGSLDAAREGYIRHIRDRAGGVTKARDRLDMAKARVEELKLKQLRAELVPATDQDQALISIASAVAARLGAVPAQVAPLVAVETDAARCQALVQDAIDEARRDLANEAEAAEARLEDVDASEDGEER